MMFASFWLNFTQKLANMPPGQNVGKHTPPNLGGFCTGSGRFFAFVAKYWQKLATKMYQKIRTDKR